MERNEKFKAKQADMKFTNFKHKWKHRPKRRKKYSKLVTLGRF